MQFKDGAEVFAADNEKMGTIDRVVLDPRTNEVTHLVVRQGFFFVEDKMIPMHLIADSNEERVVLNQPSDQIELESFREAHYITAERPDTQVEPQRQPIYYARPLYSYPPVGTAWWNYPGFYGPPATNEAVVHEQNIPDNTVALREGARVISADDQHVGEIERLFVDPESERATHILISQGLLFKDRKVVPTAWVGTVTSEAVRLTMRAETLEQVPDYTESS